LTNSGHPAAELMKKKKEARATPRKRHQKTNNKEGGGGFRGARKNEQGSQGTGITIHRPGGQRQNANTSTQIRKRRTALQSDGVEK